MHLKNASRPSDRVRKKIKNYAEIFRYIMQKNAENTLDYVEMRLSNVLLLCELLNDNPSSSLSL